MTDSSLPHRSRRRKSRRKRTRAAQARKHGPWPPPVPPHTATLQHELTVLVASGDTKITWDDADPASRQHARDLVERLKREGYAFFLIDTPPTPADEVAAGRGALLVRRIEPDALAAAPAAGEHTGVRTGVRSEPATRRGRVRAVAVRPLGGG